MKNIKMEMSTIKVHKSDVVVKRIGIAHKQAMYSKLTTVSLKGPL